MILLLAGAGFWCWPKSVAQSPDQNKVLQIRAVVDDATAGDDLKFVAGPNSPETRLRVSKEVLLDESHVKSAETRTDQRTGEAQIMVTLNNEGAARFAKATKENIGRRLAIVLNGQIVSAPRIAEAITGGKIMISGNFTEKEAQELARKLGGTGKRSENPGDQRAAVQLRSYFIELEGDPSRYFSLKRKIESASDDVTVWGLSREEAQDIVAKAKETTGIDVLSAPGITTLNGRAARVEIGDVLGKEGIYSVNARGYIQTRDPAEAGEPGFLGQSLELLPELSREKMIVAGRFIDRAKNVKNGVNFVETRYSAPIYVTIPRQDSFAVGQKRKAGEPGGKNCLLLVVIPEVKQIEP